MGPGVLRHDQHRHLRARARGLRLHPRGRGRRLLRRRVPGGARATGKPLLGHVVDGYWEDVGTLEAYRPRARGHPRRPGATSTSPASELGDGVWLGEGAEIAPDAEIDGPGRRSATTAASRPARSCGAYTVLGADVVVKADAILERSVVHDHVYVGAGVAAARRGRSAAPATCATHVRIEEGVVSATSASSASDAVINPRRQDLPVQDGRGRRASSTRRSCGRARARARCSAGAACAASPTSTSRPRSRSRLAMAYGTALQEGLGRHARAATRAASARALKRAIIAGLNLSGVT